MIKMSVFYDYNERNKELEIPINFCTLAKDFIFDKLARYSYHPGVIFRGEFGIIRFNMLPEEYHENPALIKEAADSVAPGEIVVAQLDSEAIDKFSVSDMNILEKLAFKLFFPDAPMSEDKLVFAQNVVKQFNLTNEAIANLIKKGVFGSGDIGSTAIDSVCKRAFEKSVFEALAKYTKSHKTDVKIRSGVAVISSESEILPFVLTDYLDKKDVRFIIGKVGNDRYEFFNRYYSASESDSEELDDDFTETVMSSNFNMNILVAIACLQDGIGHFDDEKFYITEDEVDAACKIAKKVIEGKYVFKLVNKGGSRILIKDYPRLHIYWDPDDGPQFTLLKEDEVIEEVPESSEAEKDQVPGV